MSAGAAVVGKRRILVVDDVELNRVLTEAVLRGATYEVDSVGDGASALAALEGKRYDLVLMDLEMPGLGGHDTAAAIRHRDSEQRENGSTRLAAISSQGSTAARLRSVEVGMAAHITRPIAPHALLREIERVFCQPHAKTTPDPWQRQLYEDWVSRLGADRMRGFLSTLNDQFRTLLMLLLDGDFEASRRLAHDVASTGGMLGFAEVTRCCRALSEATDGAAAERALGELRDVLQHAIARIDHHFATTGVAAVAA